MVRAKGEAQRAIDKAALKNIDAEASGLIHTGWAAHCVLINIFEGHPFLTKDAAQFLAVQEQRSSASIPTTLTIPPTCRDRPIRFCSAREFRSLST